MYVLISCRGCAVEHFYQDAQEQRGRVAPFWRASRAKCLGEEFSYKCKAIEGVANWIDNRFVKEKSCREILMWNFLAAVPPEFRLAGFHGGDSLTNLHNYNSTTATTTTPPVYTSKCP